MQFDKLNKRVYEQNVVGKILFGDSRDSASCAVRMCKNPFIFINIFYTNSRVFLVTI